MEKKERFTLFPKRYGYFPYVFLVYLCMPAYFVATEQGVKMVLGWGLLLLFFISYRQLYFLMGLKGFTTWLMLQIGVIVILSLYYNINSVFLGFFTANFIGWYQENRQFRNTFIIFAISISIPFILQFDTLRNDGLYYYLIYLLIMFIAPFGIRSMNSRMELEQKLDEANERIEELVKREERMRIARDLHDTLGHTLSLIALKSQLVSKLVKKDIEKAEFEAKEIERTSRTALSQVRELVSDMRTITVAEVLIESESILAAANIRFHIQGDIHLHHIPSVPQNILSMCLKESITNVVKHSNAKNCFVRIMKSVGELKIVVEDDGIGFTKINTIGNGLQGISERLELIDGEMKIVDGKRTRLEFSVPVIVKGRKVGAS
ncbi:sensor histidine kinase [Evansella sp. AB-rgal1]|uniref:sensor histidine kinase n=1 Tax=Evansella sp. AB-rgal1 TaxID=3242696 RepID=UPI00359EC223